MKNFRDNRGPGGDRGGKPFGKRDFGGRPSFGGGNRGGFGGEKRELYDATCSTCGRDCKIPFRPSGGRPVFCSNCFEREGNAGAGAPRFGGNSFQRPSFEDKKMFHATCGKCGNDCEVPFKPLAGKPVFCNNCFDKGGVNTNKNIDSLKEQLEQLNDKLDRILNALNPNQSKLEPITLEKAEAIGKKKVKKEEKAEEPAKPAAKKAAAKKKK